MRHVRLTVLLALLATALVTGCGASQQAAGAPESAELVPSDALAYVAITSDEGSEQWRRAERLLDVFPLARDALTGAIRDGLAGEELSWERDVAPALGPELVVVVTAEQRPVILTQPESDEKLRALLAKSEQRFVTASVSDWTALAEREADLAGYRAAVERGTLEDDDAFAEALAALPEETLARAWVDVAGLSAGLGTALEQSGQDFDIGLDWLSAALSTEEDGLRLSLSMRTPGGGGTSYEPKLFGQVPADAVAALSFGGTQDLVDRLQGRIDLEKVSSGLEGMLGVSLDGILDALTGEGVLYVREGETMPEVTLALAPPDPAKTRAAVAEIVGKLAEQTGATVRPSRRTGSRCGGCGRKTSRSPLPPRTARRCSSRPGRTPIRLFRGGGSKLAESDAFERAAAGVELEDRTSGFAYVDLDGLVPLFEGLAGGDRLPAEARQALESLDSFVLQSEGSGDTSHVSGFVRIADR